MGGRSSLASFQDLRIIAVSNTFSFRISGSRYQKNIFLSSNDVDDVSYVNITDIVVDSDGVKYNELVNVHDSK